MDSAAQNAQSKRADSPLADGRALELLLLVLVVKSESPVVERNKNKGLNHVWRRYVTQMNVYASLHIYTKPES